MLIQPHYIMYVPRFSCIMTFVFLGHYVYIESSGGGTFDHAVLQSLVYPEIPAQYRALGNGTPGKCKVNSAFHQNRAYHQMKPIRYMSIHEHSCT